MSVQWFAQENHGQWYVFRQDDDELRVRLHVTAIGVRSPLDDPETIARNVARSLAARHAEPDREDGGYSFLLGERVVDVGWEDSEPYVLVMDGRTALVNADDHAPETLLAAVAHLHRFLADVTPLRADVAFPETGGVTPPTLDTVMAEAESAAPEHAALADGTVLRDRTARDLGIVNRSDEARWAPPPDPDDLLARLDCGCDPDQGHICLRREP